MKKLIILLFFIPFALYGQKDFVRSIVTGDEVNFYRGSQLLNVSGLLDSIARLRDDITALQNAVSDPAPALYEADYYVATWGDDAAAGTFTEPWLTWQKAVTTVAAGDTVYIRGGTYYLPNPTTNTGVYRENVNGTALNRIVISAYPGEVPILNCSLGTVDDTNHGFYLYNCDYWTIKGLRITGVQQHDNAHAVVGFKAHTCNYVTWDNCVADNNEGTGFSLQYVDNCLIKNCDAYNNDDVYLRNNGNGFLIAYTDSLSTNSITGSRAWSNLSGEGFDVWDSEGTVLVDSCWAWSNVGVLEGDGYGFELAAYSHNQGDAVKRKVTNCIAYNNSRTGYIFASIYTGGQYYNNISYDNAGGGFNAGAEANIRTVRNNLAFDNTSYQYSGTGANDVVDHNSWQDGITVTAADFVSLDMTQLDNTRQANGNLPVITAFTLVTGSDLKNAGTDVGTAYLGAAPDIGAFEFVE